jgi:tRNA 2-thiouridine synthesizing protein A
MTQQDRSTQTLGEVEVTETLDTSGLLCPLPVYKAGIVLNRLREGETLRLITTDPGALEDVPAMARQRGDTLLAVDKDERQQFFLLRKGGRS